MGQILRAKPHKITVSF